MSWLLWIVLLWMQRFMYLFEWQFCPDICWGMWFRDHMAVLFLVFWGTSILFSVVAQHSSLSSLQGGRIEKDSILFFELVWSCSILGTIFVQEDHQPAKVFYSVVHHRQPCTEIAPAEAVGRSLLYLEVGRRRKGLETLWLGSYVQWAAP